MKQGNREGWYNLSIRLHMSNVLPEGMVLVSSKDVWVETGQKY